jgi:NADH:ubiquinone oxidoreductase subunit 5 (subunit L)/multisubunit Na+/H+ antiporter MnhA subunit
MALSVALAVGAIFLATRLYLPASRPADALRQRFAGIYKLLAAKWYFDEIYNAVFVKGLAFGGGRVLSSADSRVVDGGVNGAGWLTRTVSTISIWWDSWVVDGLVRLTAFSFRIVSMPIRLLQTGSVQAYALIFLLGMVILFGIYGRL